MTITRPASTRVVLLARRPGSTLTADDFDVVERPVGEPAAGHVLVRVEHLGLAAVMRERMDADADLPMPLYELDQPVTGSAIGTVVESARDGVAAGDLVMFEGPWAEYAEVADVRVLDPTLLPDPAHHLVTGNGATALYGVRDVAGVGEGDVVLVSGAAGGVGTLAGQVAHRLGARTVIGTAGSAAKCGWLVDELGFDAAIDYHDDDLVARILEIAPGGIDVFVDLVGGAQFEAAVAAAAPHARFAVGGALSNQQSRTGWPRLDTQTAMVKDLTVRGFALFNALHVIGEWPALFARWLDEGLVFGQTVVHGDIAEVPSALVDLVAGRYRGSVSVRLGHDG